MTETVKRTISMFAGEPGVSGIYEMDMEGISTTRCVALMLEGRVPIAFLTWDEQRGTAEAVYVNEDFRGKGIAERLLMHASTLHGSPLGGSGDGEYTAAGRAWAEKRGLNPVVNVKITDKEMLRMTSRLNMMLMGGGRNGDLIENLEKR